MSRRRCRLRQPDARRAAIAILMVLLLIPVLAFTAFCVDIGWITKTKSELQNAADASAAAGAAQLSSNYAAYMLPTQPNSEALIADARQNATAYALSYSQYNGAGDVASLQLQAADIQIGYTDASGAFQTSHPGYPNTVQVVERRDSLSNGPLPLFFAPVIGVDDSSLTATASATIYTGLISAFNPSGGGEGGGDESGGGSGQESGAVSSGFKCSLLPVAFDVNTWLNFFATGKSPDGKTYTDDTGAAQIQIYPSPKNAPGNFGMLCIGPWTNSNDIYSDWVLYGPSASDLQALVDNGQFPVSMESPKSWKGSPGLRNSLNADFTTIIGEPRLLPLFQPVSQTPYQAAAGAGSNASYNIVGFVGVTVTTVSGNGSNLSINVKPCAVIDATAVFDSATLYPAGAEPATQLRSFTHPAPKFTR